MRCRTSLSLGRQSGQRNMHGDFHGSLPHQPCRLICMLGNSAKISGLVWPPPKSAIIAQDSKLVTVTVIVAGRWPLMHGVVLKIEHRLSHYRLSRSLMAKPIEVECTPRSYGTRFQDRRFLSLIHANRHDIDIDVDIDSRTWPGTVLRKILCT
jgi:hypothetical protein